MVREAKIIGLDGEGYTLSYDKTVSLRSNSHVITAKSSDIPDKLMVVKVVWSPKESPPSVVRLYDHDLRFLALYTEIIDPPALDRYPCHNMTLADQARVLYDMSTALYYIHYQGFVHNDIKPGNILFSRNRGVVLIDFGLSSDRKPSPHTEPLDGYLDQIAKYDGTRADVALKVILPQGDKQEWEAESHIKMCAMNHDNIIAFIAAIEKGTERYLPFQWAEEINLRNLWSANRRPTLSSAFVGDVVYQIRGLADALNGMHGGEEPFRHGDLKPENILCVTRLALVKGRVNMPQLKISDLGLAKRHMTPEAMKSTPAPLAPSMGGRSRIYDMWSLGCVILETVVWLLFGNANLEIFNTEIANENG
ncbi:kinase-like domain-containing protein [Schizothecium vesticola]|uniref:Kinase-like domain-containing protein n=1 Tax=Schizothecium vesticola TaxID=314040 RepID=A0AA40EL76_9PEZI|nr:kinase-like domain-containing protein [Schizothecium vesticola]